jgi:c-di-GMP-binding flagellar brake protein YcgR
MSSILTSTSSEDERRQVERKSLRVRVRVALAGKPDMEVRAVDVSTGGMSLVVDLNLAPATSCHLSFMLPLPDGGMHQVQIAAVIAHCTYSGQRSGFVIGLQFKGASEDLKAALLRYVKS